MRPRRWALILCGSLGPLLLSFVWLETHRSRAAASASPMTEGGLPAMVLLDHTERVRTRAGRVAWQFHAARVELLTSGDYLITELDRGEFLEAGQSALVFRCDRARFEARTQNIAMAGHVRIRSPQGLLVEGDEVFWYDAADQLVVPDVARFEWQDPLHPEQPPAKLMTERLFLSPAKRALTMPDPVTGEQGPHTIVAQAATLDLEGGRMNLDGPAKLSVMAPVETGTGAKGSVKRVVLGVAKGGRIAYNARSSGTLLNGKVTVELPGERIGMTCDDALYTGGVDGTLKATGNLTLNDPDNRLTAAKATVHPADKRAEFGGPVTLNHRTADGTTLTIRAPELTFWYPEHGRRAAASQVTFDTGDSTGSAGRAEVDLQAERVLLSTRVHLRHVPRATGEEPVSLDCGRLDYIFRPGARRALATGSPTFRQADVAGAAKRLEFQPDAETLILDGQVRLRDGQGTRAKCQRLIYHSDTGEMQIEAPASAELYLSDEDIQGR